MGLLDQIRNVLKAEEGYDYASVLPLARSPEGDLEMAVPGGVREGLLGLLDALTLPGDVYAGRKQATPEDAANFALGLLGTSSVVPKPTNSLGMFGGPRARTFNPENLRRAQTLESLGSSDRQIFDETGLTKGFDGMYRFEIDDSQARLAPRVPEDQIKNIKDALFRANEGPSVGDFLRHPELYKNYPSIAKVGLKIAPEGSSYAGAFLPGTKKTRPVMVIENPNIRGREDAMSNILHEGQHFLQGTEGFETGAAPELFAKYRPEIYGSVDLINQMIKQSIDDLQSGSISREQFDSVHQSLLGERDEFARFYDPVKSYRNVSGEVEGRNVENRMDFSPAERAYKLPQQTEDVARRDQILKKDFFGLLGVKNPHERVR